MERIWCRLAGGKERGKEGEGEGERDGRRVGGERWVRGTGNDEDVYARVGVEKDRCGSARKFETFCNIFQI